ncbi:hypothetical protein [Pseudoalteromonas arctica]|uniref:hypothetical protein n=1 Tax=Pseudoalteromonas arctica TaxID=394751 RepID=UPI001473B351|nr:hypothetical protein [Pseudoalteromonas arctica]
MNNSFHGEMKAMLAHGCAFMAFTFTSIVVEGLSVMLGAPWGSKGRSAVAAPWLPPAIWQKTLNKVSNF